MKFILRPVQVADLISLKEALYWVGFGVWPIDTIGDYFAKDVFIRHRSFFPKKAYAFVNRDETVFDTLPAFPSGSDDPQYDIKLKKYFDALESSLEPAKALLFQELRNGSIVCSGTPTRILKADSNPDAWRNTDLSLWEDVLPATRPDTKYLSTCAGSIFLGGWGDVTTEVMTEEIPTSCWRMEGIDWSASSARSALGWYEKIWLRIDDLLVKFPPIKTGQINLPLINGAIVIDMPKTTDRTVVDSRKGRPPMDWDSFHLEMADRLQNGNIPDKQDSLIHDMRAWCLKNWGKEPGRSTVLQKVSPYYERFIRKKSENTAA